MRLISRYSSAPSVCKRTAVDAQKDAQTKPLPRDQLGQMVVGRGVGLEVTELLLLLGVQPPFTTSLFWRLVKAAVLVGQASVTQKGMPFTGRRGINLTIKQRYFLRRQLTIVTN